MPNPSQSGSALTVWTIVRHLLGAGHEVAVVTLIGDEPADPGATLGERVERLRALGADVRTVPSRSGAVFDAMSTSPAERLRRLWRPSDEEMLPTLVDAGAVGDAVAELTPNVALVYGFEALAASRGLRGLVPRFATVVDIPQLSAWYRWRWSPGRLGRAGVSRLLWLQGRLRHLPQLLTSLLDECQGYANFAAHHAAWLRERGAPRCEYLRTPVEDLAGPGWREARKRLHPNGRRRLLLIGHLRGISTLEGLDLFARGVLPRVEAALGPDGFEARLVGGHEAPPHLRAALSRPSVRFLGHVEDAGEEFLSADVLLVPTTIPLGTRVRILSAFSFGCPVVAHESNALGIPELADGANVLLGRTANELAGGLLRVLADESLRARLAEQGRRTYEQFFAPAAAAAELECRLVALATRPAEVAMP